MQTKIENGIKWTSCDDLGEVVEEFKKFRAAQVAAGQKSKWEDYFFLNLRFEVNDMIVQEKISSLKIYQQDGTDLSLNLAPFNFRETDWKTYGGKIRNILKEVWETGEIKNHQDLGTYWPVKQIFCDQCKKTIWDDKLAYFSDREKELDFCSENCYSKSKGVNVSEENNSGKYILITISIATVIVLVLALLLVKIKKSKKR